MRKVVVLAVMSVVLLTLAGCGSPEERRDEFYNSAQELFDQGRYSEAKVQVRNALKVDETFAPGELLLGRINIKLENWRSAFNNFTHAIEKDDSMHEARVELARLHLMNNDPEQADTLIQEVLAAEPDNAEAGLLAAVILSRRGELEPAREQAEALAQEHPESEDVWAFLALLQLQAGEDEASVATLRQGLERAPDSRNLQLQLGGTLTRMQRLDEAAAVYEELAASDTETPEMRRLLGDFYLKAGQLDDAARVAEDLVHSFPEDPTHRLALAAVHRARQDAAAEERALREGVAQVEDNGQLRLALVDLLRREGRLDDAVALAQEMAATAGEPVEDQAPDETALAARRALAEIHISRLNYDAAQAALDAIFELQPKDLDAKVLQGRVFMGRGKYEQAIALYREVLRDQPDSLPIYGLLAQAHMAANQPGLARKALEEALEQQPAYAPARRALVSMFLAQGRYSEAMTQLRNAQEQEPDNPAIQAAIGDVFMMQDNPGVAEVEYRKLLENPRTAGLGAFKLGQLEMSRGNYAQARQYFVVLHEAGPENFAAAEAVVAAYLAEQDVDGALAFAAGLRQTLPGAGAYQLMARIEAARGDFAKAETYFLSGADAAPGFNPYPRIGGMYLAAGQADTAEARFREALEKNPEDAGSAFVLGMLLQDQGEFQEAEQLYRMVLDQKPDFVPAQNNLAYLYAEHSTDPAQLQTALELALQAAGRGAPEALDTLGWVYHKSGNQQQALSTLMRALDMKQDDPAVLYHLAEVHQALGNAEQAQGYARRVLEVQPDGDFAARARTLLEGL